MKPHHTFFTLSLLLAGAVASQAANTFTVLSVNSDGTDNLPVFTMPGDQETDTIISGAQSGTVVFNMERSNVYAATDFPAGVNPQTTLNFSVTGTGTVDLRVTEIKGWTPENPYRWDFISNGDISRLEYTMTFSDSFKALNAPENRFYTIAQRALVDPNADLDPQDFQSTIYAYDETLSLIDLAAQPNLETPFLPFSGDGPPPWTATVISHTDLIYSELLGDGGFQVGGARTNGSNTLSEQVLINGWASTGNGIKSIDSTDRLAADFGQFTGVFEAFTLSGSFETGTIFAVTTNGTFTENSVAVVPEPSSALLGVLGFLLLIRRKR